MDVLESANVDVPQRGPKTDGLSYKFQRLRERLRNAVSAGELTGKLPGERELARRFHVNAKTLSKALTDLAAEGLLDRSIGRGTYVKDTNGTAQAYKTGRWLILSDANQVESPLIERFRQMNPDVAVVTEVSSIRPSFLRQFSAVLDFGIETPESFLRDLVVRNIPVVAVNREPNQLSINLVGTDRALGADSLTRDLMLGGHRHLAVVEMQPRSVVGRTVRQASARYATQATVTNATRDDVVQIVQSGATAIICDTVRGAREIRARLEGAGMRIPQDVSLTAIGCCCDNVYPCSGQFVDCDATVKAVKDQLAGSNGGQRPATIWLAPHWVDCGTVQPMGPRGSAEGAAA